MVLACHKWVLDVFDQPLSIFLYCPHCKRCTAVNKPQQHQDFPKNKLGTLRIEPRAARREARMLSTEPCSPPLGPHKTLFWLDIFRWFVSFCVIRWPQKRTSCQLVKLSRAVTRASLDLMFSFSSKFRATLNLSRTRAVKNAQKDFIFLLKLEPKITQALPRKKHSAFN